MTLVFTPYADHGKDIHVIGDLGILVGTFTFSGSYVTGGDSLDLTTYFSRAGGNGYVLAILPDARGNTAEYDNTNKKVKFYSAANTEVAAAAYNAALTATPVPIAILGK